ncbi:MAG: ATP synthase F0 subunit C [Bacteroidales bacterium]|nr:ATP synthase F0 subunit C [Bacteroidales bacterium]MBQ2482694.1 ATP synthase F0 subunit C [Bacteroidales bacterium]MBQ2491995.1 ATP synthase F0 subunit C [Bacteroidales bacterium]MBQ4196416.1 ATP synthase F0 subunit C [Bacteroidales bacterium]
MLTILSVILEYTMALAVSKAAAAIGAGIVVIGAAFGISKIGANAMDAIARQPQAAGDIRSGMILSAALIEGVALIAVIVCMLSYFVQLG